MSIFGLPGNPVGFTFNLYHNLTISCHLHHYYVRSWHHLLPSGSIPTDLSGSTLWPYSPCGRQPHQLDHVISLFIPFQWLSITLGVKSSPWHTRFYMIWSLPASQLNFSSALRTISWVFSVYFHFRSMAFVFLCPECCAPICYHGSLLHFMHVSVQMSAFQRGQSETAFPLHPFLSSWSALFSF